MLRDEVAQHYRSKGYSIRERVQVRGQSGTVHAIDMVAQGPLGNLVIAFEDEGGFEAAELNSVRRSARDIGATPVVALDRIPDVLRRRAAEAGVVLLDPAAMQVEPLHAVESDEPEQAPWPDPDGRRAQRSGKSTDPGFWRYPRDAPVNEPAQNRPRNTPASPEVAHEHQGEEASRFAWLPPAPEPTQAPAAPPSRMPGQAPQRGVAASARPLAWWQWTVGAAIFGGAAGGVFYALLRILG